MRSHLIWNHERGPLTLTQKIARLIERTRVTGTHVFDHLSRGIARHRLAKRQPMSVEINLVNAQMRLQLPEDLLGRGHRRERPRRFRC